MTQLLVEDRWRSVRWGVLLLLALCPLVLVPVTGMNWGVEDLIASTLLIVGAGLAYELALRVSRTARHRLLAVAAVVAGALLIWAELAVGILN